MSRVGDDLAAGTISFRMPAGCGYMMVKLEIITWMLFIFISNRIAKNFGEEVLYWPG